MNLTSAVLIVCILTGGVAIIPGVLILIYLHLVETKKL